MSLESETRRGHTRLATAKSVAGRDNPRSERRTSATRQALFVCLSFLYGGRCGAPERVAGVISGRFATPASFVTRSVARVVTNSWFFTERSFRHV